MGSATLQRGVHRGVDGAILFLQDHQTAWGEFAARRYNNAGLRGTGRFDSSPFTSTFVLHGLSFVDHPAVAEMRVRAQTFLRGECEEPGLWRYWTSRQGVTIDPDLDDTCCASFALWGPQRASGRREARNIACVLQNRHESGLFRTWLRSDELDNDVDGAVNANVLLYLGEREETTRARDIVVGAINADREHASTWYYCNPLALYYAVSRAFFFGVSGFAKCGEAIRRKTLSFLALEERTALSVALGLCTLINYGAGRDGVFVETLEWLMRAQQTDGCWARSAFYAGPEPPEPHQVWWGSEELTTGFCVEALARAGCCAV
jgi:hypothetical protein